MLRIGSFFFCFQGGISQNQKSRSRSTWLTQIVSCVETYGGNCLSTSNSLQLNDKHLFQRDFTKRFCPKTICSKIVGAYLTTFPTTVMTTAIYICSKLLKYIGFKMCKHLFRVVSHYTWYFLF